MSQNTAGPQPDEAALSPLDATAPPAPRFQSPMLKRCAELGIPACSFGVSGKVVESDARPAVRAWLCSEPVMSGLTLAVLQHRTAPEDPARALLFEVFPGCLAVVLTHNDGAAVAGYTAVLFVLGDAPQCVAFQRACRSAGVEPTAVASAVGTLFDRPGAAAMAASLARSCADLDRLEEQRTTLAGFTRHLSDSYDTIDLLYSVGRIMRAPFEPEQFLAFICGRMHSIMSFRWVSVLFGDGPAIPSGLRGRLAGTGEHPLPREELVKALRPLLTTGAGSPRVLEGIPRLCGPAGRQVLAQQVLCKHTPIGVIVIGGKHGDDPDVSSYDIQLLEASAGYLNAFIDNVAFYEDQHALFMGTLQALTSAIDAKDRYTCGHSERVALVASQLALASGMGKAEAERVRIAGLVHDVGKIGVPESILTKPGRLTAQEFDAIKLHPEIGHRILRDIPMLADILPAVLYHHERLDGNGYPARLSADQIPQIARLIAVADAFDAMSSDRSYRRAKGRAEVLLEIQRCSGTQLDPGIAALLATMDFTAYDRLAAAHAAAHVGLAA